MESLQRDLRYGLRVLMKTPGLSAAAVLTLALGIGASTTVFTLVDGVLLRPLPYAEAERIMGFWGEGSWSRGELAFVRQQARSYEQVSGFSQVDLVMSGSGEAQAVSGVSCSANLLATLGAKPALGRGFAYPAEEQPGATLVALLGDGLWRRAFGADPAVIGRDIHLDGAPFTIIGVMPPGFRFPSREAEIWVPIEMDPTRRGFRGGHYLDLVGLLRPGVSLTHAQSELEALVPLLQEEFDLMPGFDKLASPPQVTAYRDQVVGETRPALLLLFGAVGLVLLIGCANVANLILTRTLGRRREIAMRTALGASRGSIARQLLTESALLAVLGGTLGLLLASWGVELALAQLPADSPRLDEIALDQRAVTFCAGISVLAVFFFGLFPALRTASGDLAPTLSARGRGVAGERQWIRDVLVIAEIALAVMLVIAAGLLGQSFLRLSRIDPGFDAENVLTLRLDLSATERDRREALVSETLTGLKALPSVTAVGAVHMLPIANRGSYQRLELEGRPAAANEPPRQVYWRSVVGDYFGALGIPLHAGRAFSELDRADASPVTIIDRSLAERFWPGEDPVGQRLRSSMDGEEWVTVVGVVGAVRHERLEEASGGMMYRPLAQSPSWIRGLSLVARTAGKPESLVEPTREVVWAVDDRLPVYRIHAMEHIVADSIATRRLTAMLTTLFGALALGLAAIGVFGIFSYLVSRRTQEIGIRMALGARRNRVLRLVLSEGLRLTLIGVLFGSIGALALGRGVASLLYGVDATDPVTFVAVAVLLVAVALTACYIPGRRAASVDPSVALRHS